MPAPPLPAPPAHQDFTRGRCPELAPCSTAGTARSAARLGVIHEAAASQGLRARESAMLVQSGAAAGWRRSQLPSCHNMLRPAGAGAGPQPSPVGDARAVPSPRAPEGSWTSSGGRPRHGGSAPPVRSGAGSGTSGAGAKHMTAEASGGRVGRPYPPRSGCTCVFGVFGGPRGSRRVSCGDLSDGRDGLSGILGPLCKVPDNFCTLYSQDPDG